ncbi:MAG: cache domain-containing protein [Candidatus Omnitrophica bacterium]|nr:cache domain-containing protein [Candidatus Omnitrophota bacterium]
MRKVLFASIFMLCVALSAQTIYAEDLTPQLCKKKAIAAAKLIEAEGAAALEKIKAEDGEFRFADGKGYVWVHNLDNIMLMHPIEPSLEGKGLGDKRDVNGVYLFVAMNEIAEENGAGWVPYSWPKPGEEASSPKASYVVLVEKDGESYVAGSGMYDITGDDIKKMFPDDSVYEE